MTALHQILRERRVQLGMTQRQLAPLMTINQGHLSELETGRINYTFATALKWTAALGLRFDVRPIDPTPVDTVPELVVADDFGPPVAPPYDRGCPCGYCRPSPDLTSAPGSGQPVVADPAASP